MYTFTPTDWTDPSGSKHGVAKRDGSVRERDVVEQDGDRLAISHLAASAHGDAQNAALRRLHERHARRLTDCAYRLTSSWEDADDIVQDVFFRVWLRAGDYEARRGTVRAWLVTMTRSRALDVRRGQRARKRRAVVDPTELGYAVPTVPDANRELFRSAIALLPDPQRQLVDLAYFEGHTHAEIAATTGLALGTVKSRLLAAIRHLRLAVRRQTTAARTRPNDAPR